MDNNESLDINRDLALVRIERAEELIATAKNEFDRGDWKTANNRAFYAMEKAAKVVLATKGKSAKSHTGVLKTFNKNFIHEGDGSFDHNDYRDMQEAEMIRQSSDYDDFYIVKKDDCIRQIKNAEKLVKKAKKYVMSQIESE